MPIRKEFRHFYKGEWKTIRKERLEHAGYHCEFCGVEDRIWVVRETNDSATVVFIVLTVAHLNHDPSDNRPDNLRALCQRCHLRYDAKHHAQSRRMNRRKAQIDQGQGEFEL